MESSHEAKQEVIEKMINSFADHEPPFSSLGTPFLVDTEAIQTLVQMGEAAVPALVKALDTDNPKIVMYAAYCLGLIKDRSALQALQRAKQRLMASEPKREYDFGAISAISQAENNLLASSE